MIHFQCNPCAGVYFDLCNDGLTYFHACPLQSTDGVTFTEFAAKRDENIGKRLRLAARTTI